METEDTLTLFSNPLYFNDEFLEELKDYQNFSMEVATPFEFKTKSTFINKRINPLLKIATPNDAKMITSLIKEVYNDSYPYKEMEDEREVREMIESGKSIFILFLNKQEEIIGSTTFEFDFNSKRCSMRTWVIKKEYHGKFESTTSFIGCCLYIWSQFKDKIYLWYGEVRTAHAKTQYILDLISLKAVGFYPNKDVFYNNIESDILQVSYNKKALKRYRCKKLPKIIPEVEKCFLYSSEKFNLGSCQILKPDIHFNKEKIKEFKELLIKTIATDKFGYTSIHLKFKNSQSFMKFLYTPTVQNIEKTKYKVNSLEELFLFVQEFKKFTKELQVRYAEIFVSAYKTTHQKIFLDAGLSPRGYVPSWEYCKKKNCFKDKILFNFFKGEIDKKIMLYDGNRKLLKILGFI